MNLHPQDPAAVRCREVDSARLADGDRRRGLATIRLAPNVAGNGLDVANDVDHGSVVEGRVLPSWSLFERDVDHHPASPVSKAGRSISDARRDVGTDEQCFVELRRCDVAHDRVVDCDPGTADGDGNSTSVVDSYLRCRAPQNDQSPVTADDCDQRVDEFCATSAPGRRSR